MAKVNNFTRINADNFPEDAQDTVRPLGVSINQMMDTLEIAFNKGIDFDNLNQQYVTFTTTFSPTGVPVGDNQFGSSLRSTKGIICVNVQNLSDNEPLAGAPFVSFSVSQGKVTVNSVTGLKNDGKQRRYTLSMILIG